MKKVIVLTLAMCMLITCFGVVLAKSFSDLPSTHWAYKYVDDLSNKGIINGYEDGTFKPDGYVTNAEFIKLIMTAFKSALFFEDFDIVNANWYDKYFIVADNEGYLTSGVNATLANEPITRIQIMRVLSNIIEKNRLVKISIDEKYSDFKFSDDNAEVQKQIKEAFEEMEIKDQLRYVHVEETLKSGDFIVETDLPQFKDTKDLSDYDAKVVDLVVYSGLITGYEDDTIRPNNKVTRAEVTTITSRFYDKFGITISK